MHDHSHAGTSAGGHRTRLIIVLAITVCVLAAEVIGSIISGSLALLADAGHVFTDSAGLLLALTAITLAQRPASSRRTWGLARAEILAAAVNAAVLLGVGVWVVVESVQRLLEPQSADIRSGPMLAFGVVGLVGNLIGVAVLSGGRKSSLNMRGAFLEVATDAVASALVIAAAAIVAVTGFEAADSIAALGIAVFIVPRALRLLGESVDVLLEAAPRGIDLDEVRNRFLEHPQVLAVHDLHASTITSGLPVLTAHIVINAQCFADSSAPRILDWLQSEAADSFDIEHSTFQLEPAGHGSHEFIQHS